MCHRPSQPFQSAPQYRRPCQTRARSSGGLRGTPGHRGIGQLDTETSRSQVKAGNASKAPKLPKLRAPKLSARSCPAVCSGPRAQRSQISCPSGRCALGEGGERPLVVLQDAFEGMPGDRVPRSCSGREVSDVRVPGSLIAQQTDNTFRRSSGVGAVSACWAREHEVVGRQVGQELRCALSVDLQECVVDLYWCVRADCAFHCIQLPSLFSLGGHLANEFRNGSAGLVDHTPEDPVFSRQ